MFTPALPKKFALAFAAPILIAGLLAPQPSASAATLVRERHPAKTRGILFDDFDYRSSADPRLAAHGWTVRSRPGGPGVDGATWAPSNIAFPKDRGRTVLQLTAKTDGTAAGTSESEFQRTAEKSLAGTYVARIKFSDRPAAGPDGDHLVQSFFAISLSAGENCDPTYSETDFAEYIPNGGYGDPRTLQSETSWARVGPDCDDSFGEVQARSYAGWHTVMAVVAEGHVKYFIDGRLLADHTAQYYPSRPMAIDFNHWFIDLDGHRGSATSTWRESVDYVFYAKNRALTAKQAKRTIHQLQRHRVGFVDRL